MIYAVIKSNIFGVKVEETYNNDLLKSILKTIFEKEHIEESSLTIGFALSQGVDGMVCKYLVIADSEEEIEKFNKAFFII